MRKALVTANAVSAFALGGLTLSLTPPTPPTYGQTPVGAIVGGIVGGGIAAILLIAVATYLMVLRRSRRLKYTYPA